MAYRNQSGQILVEAVGIALFFAGLFIAVQLLLEKHRHNVNQSKLSKEVYHEIRRNNQKK